MSTFTPFHSSDELAGIPFPEFQARFTPWHEIPELAFDSPQQELENDVIPVLFSTGSDNSNRCGSDNSNWSGSEEPSRCESVTDERKRRRMISNRESARRSRMRKQKHLENLGTQLNKLKTENRELVNRLRLATFNCQVVQGDRHRLQSEIITLRQKLHNVRQILVVRQLQQQLSACNSFISVDEHINPIQLIT